ncbi:MAG: histidine kinase [Mucilaginibacter sp.]|nr:histidine kinase [Mucilaginibacter sp.]
MQLLEINIEYRVIFGISGMVVLFASFLIVFIISQRKKLQYHKKLHVLHEQQQQILTQQNSLLEKRVEERTLDLLIQKNELQKSLRELNMAQLQLIQREKMASLGELTAGIAHEIQNPLNFVNNFSDLSIELIDELRKELKDSGKEDVVAIIDNITENIERIHHHGKRADSIVKGMLEHSKVTSGQKELTDINKLADESLRLSYSSLRAKDTSFAAVFETFFDDNITEISLVPQDIARVFLNLFNNAFYSVSEKRKRSGENFKPKVSVTTKRGNDKIEIVIHDNGTGIPQKIVHKIFQPFFTTKPTGQGTGLGLSLSYDIIKAHGGEIKVESVPEESTEFIIKLPIQA